MKETTKEKIAATILAGTIVTTGLSMNGCTKTYNNNPNNFNISEIEVKKADRKDPINKEYYIYDYYRNEIIDGPFNTYEDAKEEYDKYNEEYNENERKEKLYTYGLIGLCSITIIAAIVTTADKTPKKIKRK